MEIKDRVLNFISNTEFYVKPRYVFRSLEAFIFIIKTWARSRHLRLNKGDKQSRYKRPVKSSDYHN